MKITPSTRRQFIQGATSAAAAFTIVPRHVLGGPRYVAPSEKVNIAMIGAGGKAFGNMRELFELEHAQIVAVADPMASCDYTGRIYQGLHGGRLPMMAAVEAHYAKKSPNFRCAGYEDFRVLLEKEKSVDAVLCSTPDHLHACVSIRAMRAGKHVYCEKPLSNNLGENREIARVARESGVATQMGNGGHSTEGIRQTVEWLRDGAIGKVREVHVWVRTSRWNATLEGAPKVADPVPAGFNWDLWVGPRPTRSFHSAYVPVKWRDFWDFGCGTMGDFGCHDLNSSVWAFDLQTPTRVDGYGGGFSDRDIGPHAAVVHFDFPATGAQPPLRIHWYDGGLRPRTPEALGAFPLGPRGTLFIGEKGVIQTDGSGSPPRLFPESLRASYRKPAPTIKRSPGHYREWVDACKGGPETGSNFRYASRLTEITLLGALALRTGKRIEWDAAAMQAKGLKPEADFIRTSPRAGWEMA